MYPNSPIRGNVDQSVKLVGVIRIILAEITIIYFPIS